MENVENDITSWKIQKQLDESIHMFQKANLFYFQLKESSAPLNIPTPTPAPTHMLVVSGIQNGKLHFTRFHKSRIMLVLTCRLHMYLEIADLKYRRNYGQGVLGGTLDILKFARGDIRLYQFSQGFQLGWGSICCKPFVCTDPSVQVLTFTKPSCVLIFRVRV